jgi:diguanylate cyclase (GGDEF)-like protein/PAS domain S-box-containing protein
LKSLTVLFSIISNLSYRQTQGYSRFALLNLLLLNACPAFAISANPSNTTSNSDIIIIYTSFVLVVITIAWLWIIEPENKAKNLQKQHELRQLSVLDMLTDHTDLTKILETIAIDIEDCMDNVSCNIALLSKNQQQLHHQIAPSLPDAYQQTVTDVSNEANISCLKAAIFNDQATVINDIHAQPNWGELETSIDQLLYKACYCQPITGTTGEPLGLFILFMHNTRRPSPDIITTCTETAKLIAVTIAKSVRNSPLHFAATVFKNKQEGVYLTDINNEIIYCNAAFEKISGYSADYLLGKSPKTFKSGLHPPSFYKTLWNDLHTHNHWQGQVFNRYCNREINQNYHFISVIRNPRNELLGYLAVTSDISAYQEQQQQLEKLAFYDSLTGLPNRLLLLDRLNQALIQSQRHHQFLAVVFIDIDGFKTINDHYGHEIGDRFLMALSKMMKKAIRDIDVVGRLGGDEFIVILHELNYPNDYQKPVSNLLAACNTEIIIDEISLRVTASMGISLYSWTAYAHQQHKAEAEAEAERLIKQADQAMYIAKQAGKNRWRLYDHHSDQSADTRDETHLAIQQGLEFGQFKLYYQPKVNMHTGTVMGVEGLIRWQHPKRGLLNPDQFLPSIQNHPITISLGDWVLKTAIEQLNNWQTQSYTIPISVNIDARQLNQSNFISALAEQLSHYPALKKGSLELEILETTALFDRKRANELIVSCQKLGVDISVDDFGTGFSSLTYLKELPINTIKIDRSFVSAMDTNAEDFAIVKNVINMAHSLNRKTIAEGVESIEQGLLLINMGCQLGQGFIIAKPMPADDFLAWQKNWQPDDQWVNALSN